VKPEEVIKARLIDSYVCRPIKALQGALLFEAGTAQSVLKMNILPALDFVIEDEFEKLRQVELFLAGVGEVRMPGGKLVRMATPESISSGDVKCACAREGIRFDDDLFNELVG
jgi:hypothetical protein